MGPFAGALPVLSRLFALLSKRRRREQCERREHRRRRGK